MRVSGIPVLVFLLLFTLVCSACENGDAARINAAGVAAPDATPVITPVPTPEPTMVPAPPADEVLETFTEILYSIPTEFDFSGAVAEMALPERPLFSDILQHMDGWKALTLEWHIAVSRACGEAVMQLEDRFPDLVLEYTSDIKLLDWKYAGAVLWALPEAFSQWELFEAVCTLETLDSGAYLLDIHIRPVDFQPFLYELSGTDRDLYMDARYIMTYLTTVFDEDGEEVPYVMPELTDEYIATISKPIERAAFFDRWYQGRSRNTRKHTGLDLRAAADSEIYSCTDGTVLYIGYQAIPGYYVVVLDDQGYEYHYYHMIRQTDFLTEGQRVRTGDLVGHVGNTGNSAVNHLHLALITPDSEFVKLYEIMDELYSR